MTNTTPEAPFSPQSTGYPVRAIAQAVILGLAGFILVAGCGPEFDPASLIKNTRVVGARIETQGAPDRATPMPGETVDVTWLVTSPDDTPPLSWAFAACEPRAGAEMNALGCLGAPLARFAGTASPPRISLAVPSQAELGSSTSVLIYGQICSGVGSTPVLEPQNGRASCAGGRGTTVALEMPLQLGGEANHNPTADRAFTLDGQPWPAPAALNAPCASGPRVTAGSQGHVIGNGTAGSDRETYALVFGDPPVTAPARERLQISQFTTAGELKSQFSFIEASDQRAATTVDATWAAPPTAEIPVGGLEVTFTFVTRDDRGGTDWTTRILCVVE